MPLRRFPRFVISRRALLAGTGAWVARGQSKRSGPTPVNVRGRTVDVYLVATEAKENERGDPILFAPGDGGWRGVALDFAKTMASWGRDVYGLDTKQYLTEFTGETTLGEADIVGDIRRVAEAVSPARRRVTLVGWSEGAGLMVLAATAPDKSRYAGLVTMGLADLNVMAWRWRDNLTRVTKTLPNEPTFSSLRYIGNVAPLPIGMLQSTADEYVTEAEARKLFNSAREPKKFATVQANNHRFDGGLTEFYRQLRAMLEWIGAQR
jgi:fermentation-respiration switch protein FrsA (DUF1100 family)